MYKIAVCNHKGGVGKTTTALNLACGLALVEYHAKPRKPARVLLVDMDPQANSSLVASRGLFADEVPPSPLSGKSLANVLVDENPPATADLIFTSRIPTIVPKPPMDYIAVNIPDMASANRLLGTLEASEYRLAEGLAQVDNLYKYAVVDTGTELGSMLWNALTAADGVIIPVELTGYGLTSIADTLGTIRKVQRRLNPNLQVLGIVPSRCVFQRSEAKQIYEVIKQEYGDLVFEPIHERAEISVANTESLDIFSYRPPRRTSSEFISSAQSVQEFSRFVVEVQRRIGHR